MNVAMMLTLLAAHSVSGVGTQYLPDEHEGNALYCDRPGHPLRYDSDAKLPVVALPIHAYENGWVRCGDVVRVNVQGWASFTAEAGDAGNLHSRTFRGGMPVVVDAPPWVATWDSPVPKVTVTNLSAIVRECTERGWCD